MEFSEIRKQGLAGVSCWIGHQNPCADQMCWLVSHRLLDEHFNWNNTYCTIIISRATQSYAISLDIINRQKSFSRTPVNVRSFYISTRSFPHDSTSLHIPLPDCKNVELSTSHMSCRKYSQKCRSSKCTPETVLHSSLEITQESTSRSMGIKWKAWM